MLEQIMSQVRAPAPAGCSTAEVGSTLENFFLTKSVYSKRNYLARYCQYAEFRELPRSHWAGAVESFLRLSEPQAIQEHNRYLTWLRANQLGYNLPGGRQGTGFIPITRHFQSRGLISWSLPRHYDLKSERAWQTCRPSFCTKVEEFVENLRVRNFSPMTLIPVIGPPVQPPSRRTRFNAPRRRHSYFYLA